MHPLQLLADFHERGRASSDLIMHLIGEDLLDLAQFLVRDSRQAGLTGCLARRVEQRQADWKASGRDTTTNRWIRKARRSSDWLKFRAACGVLSVVDFERLWRDTTLALATTPPVERLGVARHLYQACSPLSLEFWSQYFSWDAQEVRERLGALPV